MRGRLVRGLGFVTREPWYGAEIRNPNIERRRPFSVKRWLILPHTIQCEVWLSSSLECWEGGEEEARVKCDEGGWRVRGGFRGS
jgi:hypothetical protein